MGLNQTENQSAEDKVLSKHTVGENNFVTQHFSTKTLAIFTMYYSFNEYSCNRWRQTRDMLQVVEYYGTTSSEGNVK